MTREQIERAAILAANDYQGMDHKTVVAFTIKQINAALEEAAKQFTAMENLECDDENEPLFLHSDTCPSYCDYACNKHGEAAAKTIGEFQKVIRNLKIKD